MCTANFWPKIVSYMLGLLADALQRPVLNELELDKTASTRIEFIRLPRTPSPRA